ncbi:MAG TPA: membrane protein insertion efficiency factor YidD [Cytophagales bacterium]|nr:membrane protein insertion efficiency factor YidD [Cytophagales bacterium]
MSGYAQSEQELSSFIKSRAEVSLKTTIQEEYHLKDSKSIIKPLFILYKVVFSDQFAADCPYNPSCSQFAMECVRKKGIVRGILLGLDRLMRCNAYVDEENSYLHHDHVNDLFDDTPDMY